jgi:YgiT-type zinc finger domain-containing protein
VCAGAGSGISVAGPDAAGLTCEHGTLKAGLTTITLERDGTNIVIHNLPADVCETRGEDYVDPVVRRLLRPSFTRPRVPAALRSPALQKQPQPSYAAERRLSSWRSQSAIWFQLANVRVTTLQHLM